MAQKKAPLDPLEAAIQIIKERESGVQAREVLEAVANEAKIKTSPDRSRFMAELHTSLCLDNRVVNEAGEWRMKDAAPKPRTRGLKASALALARRKKIEVIAEADDEEEEPPVEEEVLDEGDGDESSWD